eukprot:349674-Chlamydomonas_euryale.AAC.1
MLYGAATIPVWCSATPLPVFHLRLRPPALMPPGAADCEPAYEVWTIPRSREVGQSYVTSVWTTLVALVYAARAVALAKPDVVSGRQQRPTRARVKAHVRCEGA